MKDYYFIKKLKIKESLKRQYEDIVILSKLSSQKVDIGKSLVGHKNNMKVETGKTNLRGWFLTKWIHNRSKLLGADGPISIFVK